MGIEVALKALLLESGRWLSGVTSSGYIKYRYGSPSLPSLHGKNSKKHERRLSRTTSKTELTLSAEVASVCLTTTILQQALAVLPILRCE